MRKLNRKFLSLLTEGMRMAMMRNTFCINHNWPSPYLEIKIAETEEELASAYRLLHNSYVKSGLMNPDPTGMRVLPQHLLPQTTTIIATWNSRVIGTLSLIRDNSFGLPLEKIFNVSDRRANGRRLAEISSLAVDPEFRGEINIALFPLFRFVYQYARDCFGTHEIVIAINPSMVDLYLSVMCFERLKAKPQAYDFVKGAPAVGLYLNLETAVDRWKKTFGHRPLACNFYQYWSVLPSDERNHMPVRRFHTAFDPILTPALLDNFFLKRAQLSKKLTLQEVHILMEAYPFAQYQVVLKPLLTYLSRKEVRLETQMRAEIGIDQIQAEVLNVTKNGLLLRTKFDALKRGQQTYVTIWLNQNSSTRIKVEVMWTPSNSLFGVRILELSNEWVEMINVLENEYNISKKAA